VDETGNTVSDSEHMAEVIITYFSYVFTKEDLTQLLDPVRIFQGYISGWLREISEEVDTVREK